MSLLPEELQKARQEQIENIYGNDLLIKGKNLPPGTVRNWKGTDYIKKPNGQWVPHKSSGKKESDSKSSSFTSRAKRRDEEKLKVTLNETTFKFNNKLEKKIRKKVADTDAVNDNDQLDAFISGLSKKFKDVSGDKWSDVKDPLKKYLTEKEGMGDKDANKVLTTIKNAITY